MQYEGIAVNEEQQKWLDSILDRCIMYLVGKDEKYVESLGGDAEFAARVKKFFAGSMQEVQRYVEPLHDKEEEEDDDDESSDDVET